MAIGRIETVNGVLIVKALTAAAGLTHSGPQTVDGIACVAGDLVFDKDNATGSTQGPWLIQAGAWLQLDPGMSDGLLIDVQQGTANADKTFKVTSATTWGTDTPTLVDQTGGTTGGMVTLAGVQTFTGAKTFADTKLLLRNAADTFSTTLKAAAATAARVLSLPDATDTLAALGLAQLWTAVQTIGHQLLKVNNGAATFATRIGSLCTAARDVNFPDLAGNVVVAPATPTAIVQIYSTAVTTVPADTSHAITDSSGGTPSTSTLAAQSVTVTASGCAGGATPTAAQVDTAIGTLITSINAQLVIIRNNISTANAETTLTKADALATKQVANAVIDALQAEVALG